MNGAAITEKRMMASALGLEPIYFRGLGPPIGATIETCGPIAPDDGAVEKKVARAGAIGCGRVMFRVRDFEHDHSLSLKQKPNKSSASSAGTTGWGSLAIPGT